MTGVRLITIGSGAGILALVTLIVLSACQMSLPAGLAATVDTGWGVTTMVDLYAGLLAAAGWIAYRERSVRRSVAWLVGLCLLGNLSLLVYIFTASLRARCVQDLFRPVR